MKVLQVCAYAAPYEGNFMKSLYALAQNLEENNHQMIYAFPETARDREWCRQLEKRVAVYFLPLEKARIKPSTYASLRQIFRKHPDIRIVHSHFELYDIPVTVTAPKGVKVFWHLHDAIEETSSLKSKVAHKLQYKFLHKKSLLLSVSEKHMEYTLRLGFPKKQARYIPNGLDTENICTKMMYNSEKSFDFLLFGWEFHRKGVDLCIEACRKSNKEMRIGIVGEDAMAQKIYQLYGSVKGIEIVKPVSDVNTLYARSKCFLHISRAEGLSYALLEAIYAGLPVICSDIKENMFARDFPTVRMVKSDDIDSIVAAMEEQMEMKSVDTESVMKAREIIDRHYSINCWVKSILSCYGVEDA